MVVDSVAVYELSFAAVMEVDEADPKLHEVEPKEVLVQVSLHEAEPKVFEVLVSASSWTLRCNDLVAVSPVLR